MRTISANLKAHLAQTVTTLATCWKLVRSDSEVFGFTDNDAEIVYDGVTYTPLNSGSVSAAKQSDNLTVDNLEIEMILNSEGIDEDDIRYGKYDYAEIWVFMINYETVADGIMKISYGKLGEIQLADNTAKVEVRGLIDLLNQNIGRVYLPDCDADFGDSRCGINLVTSGYFETTPATAVTSVTNNKQFISSGMVSGADVFNYGTLWWITGNNANILIEVKTYSASKEFVLLEPMPFTIEVGDTHIVYYGCDRTFTQCKAYNNSINFRGFPTIPGIDEMMDYPGVKQQ